jgi:excisionase family DNA binding protein
VQDRLLSADEVAQRLGFSKQTIWGMARRGELPTVRIGTRRVKFSSDDLERWIERRTTTRPRGTR